MKLKTHSGAAKRFKKTGTGKFVRASAFKRHILTSKATKRSASCAVPRSSPTPMQPKLHRMLPYK